MKIFLLTLFFLCLTVSVVTATPFLVCDPYPTTVVQPSYFELAFDGGSPVQSTSDSVTGGVRLHYDLASITAGNHTSTVKACNQWGCSAAIPFPFSKGVPTTPAGIKLE